MALGTGRGGSSGGGGGGRQEERLVGPDRQGASLPGNVPQGPVGGYNPGLVPRAREAAGGRQGPQKRVSGRAGSGSPRPLPGGTQQVRPEKGRGGEQEVSLVPLCPPSSRGPQGGLPGPQLTLVRGHVMGAGERRGLRVYQGLRPPHPLTLPTGVAAMVSAGAPWAWMLGALITALIVGAAGKGQYRGCMSV